MCVCVCVCACMHAKSLQSCLTLCHPMDCSLPDPSVHGILQARILEWVAMPSSTGSSWPRDQTCISYVSCIGSQVLSHQCHPFFLAHRLSCSVACGIFPNRDWSRVSCTGRFFATEPPGKPRILLSLLTWLPFHCQPSPHLLSSLWLAGLVRKWLLVSYLLQFCLLTFQISNTFGVTHFPCKFTFLNKICHAWSLWRWAGSPLFSPGKRKKNNKGKDDVLTYWILKPDISLMYLESSDQESEGQC